MNWRTISAELTALPKILLSRSLKMCFHFRVVFADSLHLSTEYLAKSQPSTSPCRTRWPLGHRSEEIYAFSTVSFDKTSARPLHLVQVLVLPPDDITRRLKKPEFYLSTTITIRVEMTSLITHESHSDYQHTSILTHSNSTTTTIRMKKPWLCPPTITKKKIVIVDFTGCVCSPILPYLWKLPQNEKISPSSKTTTSVH